MMRFKNVKKKIINFTFLNLILYNTLQSVTQYLVRIANIIQLLISVFSVYSSYIHIYYIAYICNLNILVTVSFSPIYVLDVLYYSVFF